MKTILKFTAVVAFMFITMTSRANELKFSLVADKDAKSLVFELESGSKESIVKLIDGHTNIIYQERISNEGYAKRFNLKDLEPGTYYFSVENPIKNVVYTLNVERTEVEIVKRKDNKAKVVFRKVGDKVYVNLLNQDLDKVDIKIVNGNNTAVYHESFNDSLTVGKVFNFEKAIADRYTIVVSDGHDSYYENIEVY